MDGLTDDGDGGNEVYIADFVHRVAGWPKARSKIVCRIRRYGGINHEGRGRRR